MVDRPAFFENCISGQTSIAHQEIRLHHGRERGGVAMIAETEGSSVSRGHRFREDKMVPFETAARSAVLLGAASAALALAIAQPARAAGPRPDQIGVIAEAQAVAGSSIPPAAQIAADEINAKGGVDGRKIEIVSYDNHSSSAESVRAFQRAVNEDHVNAVIASYISEVVLALEPWAGRLKTVMITPGAASDVITQNIAKDYEHNKYTFHGYLTSSALSELVCDAAKDMLVDGLKMKTAVIMSEDAAWTTPLDAGYSSACPRSGSRCSTTSASRPTPPISRRSSTRSRARSPT